MTIIDPATTALTAINDAPVMETVALADMIVDPHVQRAIRPNQVNRMVREFNPGAVGAITLSLRPGGELHIVDGQNRAAAAREALGEGARIPALVHVGLTLA